jgi:hypothetical protein
MFCVLFRLRRYWWTDPSFLGSSYNLRNSRYVKTRVFENLEVEDHPMPQKSRVFKISTSENLKCVFHPMTQKSRDLQNLEFYDLEIWKPISRFQESRVFFFILWLKNLEICKISSFEISRNFQKRSRGGSENKISRFSKSRDKISSFWVVGWKRSRFWKSRDFGSNPAADAAQVSFAAS